MKTRRRSLYSSNRPVAVDEFFECGSLHTPRGRNYYSQTVRALGAELGLNSVLSD